MASPHVEVFSLRVEKVDIPLAAVTHVVALEQSDSPINPTYKLVTQTIIYE